jgi:hypothetical protein
MLLQVNKPLVSAGDFKLVLVVLVLAVAADERYKSFQDLEKVGHSFVGRSE